ncbi:hypothetical protein MBLNU459_g2613t1 [Dothideomycetes sp. NU459]
MEGEERPSKIRKLSHGHARDEAADAPAAAETDSSHASHSSTLPLEQPQQPSLPTNGATDPSPGLTAEQEPQADASASKNAHTSPVQPLQNGAPSIPDAATPVATLSGTAGSSAAATTTSSTATPQAATASAQLSADGGAPPMSKNQLKKLRRQQEWDAKREDRKIKRKEKVVEKRERKRAERDAAKEQDDYDPEAWKAKQKAYVKPSQLPITIVMDCDFDEFMRDNERVSLAGQITRSYSDNKNAKFRAHLAISSFGGKLRERFDGVLAKNYLQWKGTHFLDEDFVEAAAQAKGWMAPENKGGRLKSVFAKHDESDETRAKALAEAEVIYLSSDSDYTLTELKPYSTYIVGGLVDKNREKGICHKRAVARNIKTARLPIGDYLEMASRKVLATNHVNEIMLKWLECGDWGDAFMSVIPKRKGGQLKGPKDGQGDDEGGEEEMDDAEDAKDTAAGSAPVQQDEAMENGPADADGSKQDDAKEEKDVVQDQPAL